MSQLIRTSFAIEREGSNKLHVLPPGPVVVARDKRIFQVSDAAKAVDRSEFPMLVDWEHESEVPWGSSQAAGWVTSAEVRSTGVWATVEWTPKGKADVESQAYRFLSPVLELDNDTREVLAIVSIALTNKPALHLSPVGDVAAYREKVRIACSTREATSLLSTVPRAVLEKLRANGMSDAQIESTLAFQQSSAYSGAGKQKSQPTEDEVRAACLRRGMSGADYDSTRKFMNEQRSLGRAWRGA